MSLLKSANIFIKEQVREPIGVFWAFGAPLAYIVMFSNSPHTQVDQTIYLRLVGLCLAYIALTTSVFNFGLYWSDDEKAVSFEPSSPIRIADIVFSGPSFWPR
ncbi:MULTISPECIES: hypothetical protein [unclassified Caballeronia]|uniref:hypothetical protein n=1 Tax=unclassified Caballeronia TaxID=2646786 RepID=UPI002857986E|nr:MULTISPECIES: hypothetical protein [unclassified Caballeronia]MDR5753712.1 hypothetical protein [Caballeronia sp. LZ024]MDR5840091.1 hypothetical protein [Caballeronia sp. LZ031]